MKLEEVDKVIVTLKDLSSDNKDTLYTKLINHKFDLLSKIRSHTILLDKLNNDTNITIDGTELSVYEALHLLKTFRHKIDTFSSIIIDDAKSLNIFDLMDKKDKLLEEYIDIYMAVQDSDINTIWEN
ncbi:hypothetical protein JZU46_00225 [bacterium]|nr:hypothetical protein [bacterium]